MDSLTRDEHYREAAEFDADAARMFVENPVKALLMAQRAQTHATLALVVAQGGEVVEARVHDDHGAERDPWCKACADEAVDPKRESRECVLTCIGAFMPDIWDWPRLENEFIGQIGLPIEDASVPDLQRFRAHLGQLRRQQSEAPTEYSDVPPW